MRDRAERARWLVRQLCGAAGRGSDNPGLVSPLCCYLPVRTYLRHLVHVGWLSDIPTVGSGRL